MDDFFIDKLGNDFDDDEKKTAVSESEDDDFLNNGETDLFNELPDAPQLKDKKPKRKSTYNIDDTYLITSYKNIDSDENAFSNVGKVLEKSVLRPGLEKRHAVPSEKSKRVLQIQRKKRAKKTKGKDWFNMKSTELTEEVKTDFELLKMRSVLDKKHVYKKNDITKVPKYFQVGRIVESAADFYSGRIPKSQRKKTMVEELLADAEFKNYQKKKFKEIMDNNRRKKLSQRKAAEGGWKKKRK